MTRKRTAKTAKLPRFMNKYNAHLFTVEEERNSSPSKTIPGEDMDIKEYVKWHTTGDIPEMAEYLYDGDENEIDIDADISDRNLKDLSDIDRAVLAQATLERESLLERARIAKEEKLIEANDELNNDKQEELPE